MAIRTTSLYGAKVLANQEDSSLEVNCSGDKNDLVDVWLYEIK